MIIHKPLSCRVQEIRPSGIRKIFDLACQYPDGLDLSIGNPDFDVPEPIKNEAIFQIKNGFNQYVSTRGIDDLRHVIIKDHKFNVIKPQGAFYIFPEAPDGDAEVFVNKAIEHKVFIIPGRVFSEKNSHFRISYAVNDETLEKAVDALKKIRD